jgi:hypothetical protein
MTGWLEGEMMEKKKPKDDDDRDEMPASESHWMVLRTYCRKEGQTLRLKTLTASHVTRVTHFFFFRNVPV